MALMFYWRCEGTTLDGTHDYSAGDTTASANNSVSISATAAKLGSNGLLADAVNEWYSFSSASIVTIDQGSVGFWLQWKTGVPAVGDVTGLRIRELANNNAIQIKYTTSNEVQLDIAKDGVGSITLNTTAANCAVDNWYFITISWHLSADKRRIRVYNSSGTLINAAEDTSTDLATNTPSALDTIQIGNPDSSHANQIWIDNIFVGSEYADADDFLTNRDITSYTSYSAGAPPTFDTSPTVTSQTATAYTLTYDADANATNIYVGIYLKDAATPTAAQIKAGTNAHGTATEATTGASDTIAVTASESPAFPIYDVYAVLEGAGGFSSVVALVDEALDPATGKQHITADVSGGITAQSIFYGASPAVATGDRVVIDTHVDSAQEGADAHVLTCGTSGLVSVDPGLDTSRLDFYCNVYDVDAGAWLSASPVRVFINNVPPDYSDETSTFLYQKSVAITANPRESSWTDQEGDALTITLQDALPAGLSFGSETVTGTPTTYGRTVVTERAADITAEYTEHETTYEIGDLLPDVVGIGRSSAEGVIGAFMSCTTQVVEAINASVAAGQVYGQEPSAGTLVPHDQLVTLLVSLGASETAGGGVSFFDAFERARRRREKKRREEEEAEEEAALLKAEADREIALLLQEQERKDEERRERERLQELAKRYAGEQAAELYGERLATAMQRAAEKGTYSAIEAFVREAKRAQEEEAFVIRAAIMAIELNG